MTMRSGDEPNTAPPVRAVSMWQVFTFAFPFFVLVTGQAIVMYGIQREQAVEMKHFTAAMADFAATQKAMALQLSQKDGADVKQDGQILDHERRLTRLEGGR